MQDPYEEFHRYERRRHRAQVAIVLGALAIVIAAASAAVIYWRVSAEDQRIASAFDTTAPPR